MGKIKDALESFDNAIECDANFADAYGNRAQYAERARPQRRGAVELRPRGRAQPEFAERLAQPRRHPARRRPRRRGDRQLRQGDCPRPGLLRVALQSRARIVDVGRDAEALAEFDRAIALEPKMAEAYLGRALALKKLSRLEEALASIDKAIEIKGDVAKMHEARASLLRSLGREDDARATDARAAELEASKQKTATQEAAS